MILTGLILGTVLDAFGVISLEASTFPWLGTIIGGFIFGFAIVLAGGCATGTYYRAGEGLVGSWLALIFYMIGATVFRVGPLSGTTDGIRSIETQNGSFQEALGVSPWIFVAILVAVVAVAAASRKACPQDGRGAEILGPTPAQFRGNDTRSPRWRWSTSPNIYSAACRRKLELPCQIDHVLH